MERTNPAEPGLSICLLGGCKLQSQGKIIRLETAKTSALLAYLALQTKPQTRQKLLGLFWGDQTELNARRSLRHALWNIRQQLQRAGLPEIVVSEGQEIAINPATEAWIDVVAFERCLKNEAEINAATDRSDDRYALLRRAADLYGGDLLDGVYVDEAGEFETWLLLERERLRAQVLDTLQRLVEYYASWGEVASGLEYARRLLNLEPWLEEAHRQTMRLLALSGQRLAALAAYETCRRVLAEELNAEPSDETQALYDLIRADAGEQTQPSTPQRRLPAQATPFVGREEELAQLADRLADPTCRLISLVGPGGIGKTRLAVRAAAQCQRFRDGICFVPLVGVASSELLAPAVADALGVELHGGESIQAQLLEWLCQKELLLVLDNFEHLLAAAEWVVGLLRAAPDLKIMDTSRERLNLSEEWLFPVEGLRYPTREDENLCDPILDRYAAVRLFVQGAQRVRLGFVLSEADRPLVARLCRLVAGMPLAIELAANWVRLLTCQEIVTRVEASLDFLTTSLRDVPARHRSMRAVFEQSWQMLSEEEREVFKRLSVLRGGFRQEAGEAVAGANLDLLASLVDKSFLRRSPSGRYEVHELLRQYGEEIMSEAEAAQAREAHGVYFARFLSIREEELAGQRCREVLEEIAEEVENVRAGWTWAVHGRHFISLEQSETALYYFYEFRSWFQEGKTVFERAAAALRPLAPEPVQQRVLAKLTLRQAYFTSNRLTHYSQALPVYEDCIAIARQIDEPIILLRALANFGASQSFHGTFVESRRLLEEALEGFSQLNNRPFGFVVRMNLGYLLCLMGEYPRARVLIEQVLARPQDTIWPDNVTFAHYFLGLVSLGEGDAEQATQWLQRGLAFSRTLAPNTWGATLCLCGLASVALQNGQYKQATRLAQESLIYARQGGNGFFIALCLNCLGQSASAIGQVAEAQRYYQQAIQIAWETEQWPPILEGVIGLAELEFKEGRLFVAGELLAFVIHHPSTVARERDRAVWLFGQVASQLTPDELAAAIEQGEGEALESVVKKLLQMGG